MPPTAFRGSRRAMEQVYADVGPRERRRARRRAARLGLNADDAEQDVDLLFVELYLSHDPAKSDFSGRLSFTACARITDEVQRRAVRRKHAADVPVEATPHREAPEPYSLGRLTRFLGSDARFLVALAFDAPEESGHDAWATLDDHPDWHPSRHLKTYLAGLGWSPARVRAAFDEVREML